MTVFDTINNRRSIRKYKDEPIKEESIEKILEAARLSHSARNAQDWKFIAVTDKDKIEEVASAMPQDFGKNGTLLVVGCGIDDNTYTMRCGQPRPTMDLAIATENMQLVAWEEGIGSCWIGGFDADVVREALDIPEGMCAVTLTVFGIPAEDPDRRPRKSKDEVISYNKY